MGRDFGVSPFCCGDRLHLHTCTHLQDPCVGLVVTLMSSPDHHPLSHLVAARGKLR